MLISNHRHNPYYRDYFSDKRRKNSEVKLQKVRKELTEALKCLGAEAILDEWVWDVDSASKVASEIRKGDFDLVIFYTPEWTGGDAILALGQNIPADIPLILWTFVENTMELCAFFEMTSDLKAVGRRFKPIIGKTQEAMEQIKCYMRAAKVAKKLRSTKVAQIGYSPPTFVDTTACELDLRAKLGIEIVHLDIAEILSKIKKITDEEVVKIISGIKKKVGKVEVSDENLVTPAKIYAALDRMVKQYKLSGYAFRCSPMNYEYCFPCLALSMLSEKGIAGACEGDLTSAITMIILRALTGNVSVDFDIDSGKIETNVLKLFHCGHAATTLAESPENIIVTLPSGPIKPFGAVICIPLKLGRVTLAKMDIKGEKMFIASGKVIRPQDTRRGDYAEVKLDSDLIDLLNKMAENGVSHHLSLVYGDVTSELEALCEILEIQPITC